MTNTSKKRGRPPKANVRSAAKRMRDYRKRKKALGLKQERRWVSASQSMHAYSDHALLDARSLVMHCVIAKKISQTPEAIIQKAQTNLQRWAANMAEGPKPSYFDEWQTILNGSWQSVAYFITSFSEQAIRLRQSSPFAGVLTSKERKKIYDAFRT